MYSLGVGSVENKLFKLPKIKVLITPILLMSIKCHFFQQFPRPNNLGFIFIDYESGHISKDCQSIQGYQQGGFTTIKYQCGVINKQCHFMNIILNLPPLILELVSLTEREFEQKLRTNKVL